MSVHLPVRPRLVLFLALLLGVGCGAPRGPAEDSPSAATFGAEESGEPRRERPPTWATDREALLAIIRSPLTPRRSTLRAAEHPLAFVGVTVVPMDGERQLTEHTVLVRDGRIAALGPSAEIELPEGARVLDGAGLFLMPGLADMHVHAWSPDHFLLFLANGVTTVRNMFGSPLHLEWRERIATRQWLGPRLVTAGPILDGNPPVWNGSIVATTPADAAQAVREQQSAGYDFIKVYDRLKPEVYAAILETARQLGLPVSGHVPPEVGLAGALAARQHSIEHLAGFAAALHPRDGRLSPLQAWLAFDEADATLLPALSRKLREADTWSCPTLVVTTKTVAPEEGEALSRSPEMRFVAPATLAQWKPANDFRFAAWTAETYAQLRRGDELRKAAVRALHEVGAGLLLGTDAHNPYVVPGFSIHEELRLLVDAGLSPYEALACGTSAVGRFLGEPRRGTVAVGAPADLLLLEADPLADVAHVKQLRGVLSGGLWLPVEELQVRLELVARSYGHEPR